jgi:hypothetical protein
MTSRELARKERNERPPEDWKTVCPLCCGLFRDWSTRRSHLLLEHEARSSLIGCAVLELLEKAPTKAGLFRCWICPAKCAMLIDNEGLMGHLTTVHHSDPKRIEQYKDVCECFAFFSA